MLHEPKVQPARKRVLSVRSGESYRVTGSISKMRCGRSGDVVEICLGLGSGGRGID